jgi:hypothetical protein
LYPWVKYTGRLDFAIPHVYDGDDEPDRACPVVPRYDVDRAR